MISSDISIFDADFALKQFNGNQSLLVQILEKFILQYQNFNSDLKTYLQEDNHQLVKQYVHTLKGVSGNLGIQAIHAACGEFEAQFTTSVSSNTLESFEQLMQKTLSVLAAFISDSTVQDIPKVVEQMSDKDRLIRALKRNEFVSDAKMQAYLKNLDLAPDTLSKLQQAIDNLDYSTAISLLQ